MSRTPHLIFLLLIFLSAIPASAKEDCDDSWFLGPWIVIVTGVEVYDYSVWMIADGQGMITDMGAFSVPFPAGVYSVQANCDMVGQIWTDGYTPFTGHFYSESLGEMDMGLGPFPLLRVTDPGALEDCWSGRFEQEGTGVIWNVTLDIDAGGNIVSSTGFPGQVSGMIFTEDGYLAGFLSIANLPVPDQIFFQEASAEGTWLLSGTYDMDCNTGCPGGTFELVPCTTTGAVEGTPTVSTLDLTNYPNPFNPGTTISFTLADPGPVKLNVYDVSGRLVKVIIDNQAYPAGRNQVVWRGRDSEGQVAPAGVFFYRLEAGRYAETNRMVMMK